MTDFITIYDSTLRDGAQARGVDFTLADKRAISHALDGLGIDYIEGGWPGANPKDDAFFENPPTLEHATITAFGMTRRAGHSAANDPVLSSLINTGCKHLCIVGKTWDFHIDKALEISHDENKAMIADSIKHLVSQNIEVMFDAEHFFDGFKHNRGVAMEMIEAAYEAGARWIVLCDTNGGSMPNQIEEIVREVCQVIPGENLGIHCHNDTEQAVANSLAAVRAGVRQVQGTLNGIGERCGNANLVSLIPSLMLKMGFETNISEENLARLTYVSRMVDDILNRVPNAHSAYVGEAAFAHKGGLHVSAMAKDTSSYEHIAPELVGNERQILVSDKAGRSNVVNSLKATGLLEAADKEAINALVDIVKERETLGYAYENAAASFELLARKKLQDVPDFFNLESFRVVDERRFNAEGTLVTISEATVKLEVEGARRVAIGEGNGPVNALDAALRSALTERYPEVNDIRLTDYKVRILTPGEGTGALTRVLIETTDTSGEIWNTIGVSANIIEASYIALREAITMKLL